MARLLSPRRIASGRGREPHLHRLWLPIREYTPPVRHQPRLRAAVRLRQQHGPRGAARQRPLAARTAARRREPLHAPVGRGGRRTPQRLRVAGPAAARHGVLRGGALRAVPRRAAYFAENRRRKGISGPSSCVFTGKSLLL